MTEYNKDQFKNFDKSRFDNEAEYRQSVVRGALNQLSQDGALGPILRVWERNQLQPEELITREPKIYKTRDDDSPRDLKISNDVDKQLAEERLGENNYKSYVRAGFLNNPLALTAEQLSKQITKDNLSTGMARVTKQLKTGDLWMTLLKEDQSEDGITLKGIQSARAHADKLNLSADQVKALDDLQSEWNQNDGVKPFRVDETRELHSMNPVNEVNPFFGLNPADQFRLGSYRTYKSELLDYIPRSNLDDVLNQKFDSIVKSDE